MIRMSLMLAGLVLALPASAAPPLTVEIVTVEKRAEPREFSLTGEIVAREPVDVAFATGGRLAAVPVEAGDRVAAGAVLARLEAAQQEQALRAAQAALASAQADFRQAKEDFERQDRLLARGATTRIARDEAEDALNIAQGSLAQAEAALDLARKAVNDTVLMASDAATVIERLGEPGEVIGAAQPVIRLAVGDALDALFDVPEALLVSGDPPSEVRLTLIDHPERSFAGQVREISPLVDTARGTVAVTVSVLEPPDVAGFGDAVVGTVRFAGEPQIVLPHSAIAATETGPAVWVVDPDTMAVSLTPIAVARFEAGRVVLDNGLAPGTLVVARGAHLLFPGRVVQPVEDAR
ncbi:efflux RND transporter periplasmic adaptor subunit [Rhodovulum euryhalinum]|uniref:RND family efflux transporter MFP subunit n=1 Tax=Rhodovulum euryhalinum TaxID=35805 RepID=A0A4R2K7V4_9RHOB|nr:efflux RND transporter periplasmic adaptor subunit [Rhodovulum euryhalinum]TCO69451.1 RND family efflux transporter MFP subunit [Rhodovulum euryhalinum]